jgi:hypothetical protein
MKILIEIPDDTPVGVVVAQFARMPWRYRLVLSDPKPITPKKPKEKKVVWVEPKQHPPRAN